MIWNHVITYTFFSSAIWNKQARVRAHALCGLWKIYKRLDPVQTSNFTCAELNARVKRMWSATFESVKFDCLNQMQRLPYLRLKQSKILLRFDFWFKRRISHVSNLMNEFYRKIHYLTRKFHVKLHAKIDIARIAKRWVRYRFSSAI